MQRNVQRSECVASSGESAKIGKVVEKKATVKNEQNLYMHRKASNTTSTAQGTDRQLQAAVGNPSSSRADLHSTSSTTEPSISNARDVETEAATGGADEDICCMCDRRIDVKLVPCGHRVMCSACIHKAKRCPTCMVGHLCLPCVEPAGSYYDPFCFPAGSY